MDYYTPDSPGYHEILLMPYFFSGKSETEQNMEIVSALMIYAAPFAHRKPDLVESAWKKSSTGIGKVDPLLENLLNAYMDLSPKDLIYQSTIPPTVNQGPVSDLHQTIIAVASQSLDSMVEDEMTDTELLKIVNPIYEFLIRNGSLSGNQITLAS